MAGEPRDLAELIEELREASTRGLFDGDALVMLEGVLAVADMQVRDIMVPRSQMVFVERDEPADRLVALVVESGHSRFPVIGEDRDQILGILLAKDLLRLQVAGDAKYEECPTINIKSLASVQIIESFLNDIIQNNTNKYLIKFLYIEQTYLRKG